MLLSQMNWLANEVNLNTQKLKLWESFLTLHKIYHKYLLFKNLYLQLVQTIKSFTEMIFHHFETLIPQDFLTKSTGAFQLELLLTMLIERDGRLVNRKTTFSNNGEIPSNRKNILTPNFNPHKELCFIIWLDRATIVSMNLLLTIAPDILTVSLPLIEVQDMWHPSKL